MLTQGSKKFTNGERDTKKGQRLLCERNEVKYDFIQAQEGFPINKLCQVMQVRPSGYYAWRKRPAVLISADDLRLYRKAKELFKASRESLGSRELSKKLKSEGFYVGRKRTRTIMKKLKLIVRQRVAYKVTTKRNLDDAVAVNLLNQNFNPVAVNEVWAGDITYLKTAEGWMYLAIVMDLYSRRIVGWPIDKRMTTDLISKALMRNRLICGSQKKGGCFIVTEGHSTQVNASAVCCRVMA